MNGTGLVENLTWALIELQDSKPDLEKIRSVLSQAVEQSATLSLKSAISHNNTLRLAKVWGES